MGKDLVVRSGRHGGMKRCVSFDTDVAGRHLSAHQLEPTSDGAEVLVRPPLRCQGRERHLQGGARFQDLGELSTAVEQRGDWRRIWVEVSEENPATVSYLQYPLGLQPDRGLAQAGTGYAQSPRELTLAGESISRVEVRLDDMRQQSFGYDFVQRHAL